MVSSSSHEGRTDSVQPGTAVDGAYPPSSFGMKKISEPGFTTW